MLGVVAGREPKLVGRARVPRLPQRLGEQAGWQRPLDLDVGALHLGLEGVELAAEDLAGARVPSSRLADLLARAAQADLERDQDLDLLRLGDGSRVVEEGEVAAHDRAVQVEGALLGEVAGQRVGVLGEGPHDDLKGGDGAAAAGQAGLHRPPGAHAASLLRLSPSSRRRCRAPAGRRSTYRAWRP